MEKFLHIVCRLGNLRPGAVVVVTTVRALKHHGEDPDGGLDAVERGAANLERHIGIVREFGLEPIVAVNRRPEDTDEECDFVRRLALDFGAHGAELNEAYAKGGEGATALAEAVVAAVEQPNDFHYLYDLDAPIAEKIETIATRVYKAKGVNFLPAALQKIERYTKDGLDRVPICMAKSHLSLSHDPELLNAPTDFTLPVRDLRAYTGAGWIVALCGDMQTMPGLRRDSRLPQRRHRRRRDDARPVLRAAAASRGRTGPALRRRAAIPGVPDRPARLVRRAYIPPDMAVVIDGTRLAGELREKAELELAALARERVKPGLATILTGDDYAAHAYERRLRRIAEELGCRYVSETLPGDVEEADMLALVGKLNADPRVSGILILRPIPRQVSEAQVYRTLNPLKDIEALHPENAGLLALGQPRFTPSTPASAFYLLDRYVEECGGRPSTFYNGLELVLVGRSNNVGKPAMWLGLARNATVSSCHQYTSQAGRLEEHTRRADILVVAAGVPGLVGAEMVKEGVIAVDVGINPIADPETGKTRLVGDLDYESVAAKAAAITPVPGGVGPVTDVWLLRNTIRAAGLQAA